MLQRVQSFFRHLRRRRRRFWRYVSPQRRGTALVLLALLMVGVYGYWHLTNGRRVKRVAETYLRNLTGADVEVRRARFRMFGRLELDDVVVRLPGDESPDPPFRARRVSIPHRPLGLLITGDLDPKEIICHDPEITVEYYGDTPQQTNWARLAKLAQGSKAVPGAPGAPVKLAPIRLPECRVRAFRVRGNRREPLVGPEQELRLSVSLIPQAESRYELRIGELAADDAPFESLVTVDMVSGRLLGSRTTGSILDIAKLLPPKYGELIRRHFLRGTFSTTWDTRTEGKPISVDIEDATVRPVVPAADPTEASAGLKLTKVRGRAVFSEDGGDTIVSLTDFSGRIPDAGDAEFTLSGKYRETGAGPAFDVRMGIDAFSMPVASGEGSPGELLDQIRRMFRPEGPIDLRLRFAKLATGATGASGTADCRGLRARYSGFPYPLENVTGRIEFGPDRVSFDGLKAERGEAAIRISGWVATQGDNSSHDIVVDVHDVPFDDAVRAALPDGIARVCEDLAVEGVADMRVRVWRDGGGPKKATLRFLEGNRTTTAHRFFPYRTRLTGGCLHIVGDRVILPRPGEQTPEGGGRDEPLRAERGETKVTVYGRIDTRGGERGTVDLTIETDPVPIDEVLLGALGPAGRESLEGLAARGTMRDVVARIRQDGTREVDYTVTARLAGLRFRYEGFPYEVRDAAGMMTVHPDRVLITNLTAHHGPTRIRLNGQVFTEEAGGADLAMELTGLRFDEELYAALGPKARQAWRQMNPQGTADVRVRRYRENTPENPGDVDYEVEIAPTDMTFRYVNLPYVFRVGRGGADASAGRIVLYPDRTELVDLRTVGATDGPRLHRLSGTVRETPQAVEVRLTALKASGMLLDAERLQAMDRQTVPILPWLLPGGEFDVDLTDVTVVRPHGATIRAAATRPADGDAPATIDWRAAGAIALHGAVSEFGFGPTVARGTISGSVARVGGELVVDGRLSDFAFVPRRPAEDDDDPTAATVPRISGVNATIVKDRGRLMQIRDLSGKAYRGRFEGSGVVQVAAPFRYGLKLTFEGMRIEDLLTAGGGEGVPDVRGMVDGSVELRATAGDLDSREASGALRITRARFARLPVLLGFLDVVTLSLPGKAFSEGFVTYYLKGRRVVFEEIHLGGGAASLVGSGNVDLKSGKINLTFLQGRGGLPRLGSIEELLTGILREIAEVRVTGKLDEPKVDTVPLRSVRNIIDILRNPERGG